MMNENGMPSIEAMVEDRDLLETEMTLNNCLAQIKQMRETKDSEQKKRLTDAIGAALQTEANKIKSI